MWLGRAFLGHRAQAAATAAAVGANHEGTTAAASSNSASSSVAAKSNGSALSYPASSHIHADQGANNAMMGAAAGSGQDTGGGFFASLAENPIFSAGAGVAGLGVGLALARGLAIRGILLAQRRFTVSLEVSSKDASYPWVLQWISASAKLQEAGKNRLLAVARTQHLGVETSFAQNPSTGTVHTRFDFVPSPGRHWLRYGARYIQVVRERDSSMLDLNSGKPWETVTLTTLGQSRAVFERLLEDARAAAERAEQGKTVIYNSIGTEWRAFGRPRRKRPIDSVILAPGLADRIVRDVREFGNSTQWYIDRGIPYRRGYLLHGPPGCGKSSFIQALAGLMDYNICLLNLNQRGLTDDHLNVLMSVTPPRSLLLLEDVDAAFAHEDAEARRQGYTVTFSGLLNCLDGVASTEERVVFMTTNHIERLDPALIRPGRVDMTIKIDYADSSQQVAMFERFYPSASKERKAQFIEALNRGVVAGQVSIAELQGYFMFHKHDVVAAVEGVEAFFGDRTTQGNLQRGADPPYANPETDDK